MNEYLKGAKKCVRKHFRLKSKDDEVISYVAYHGMLADKKFDPEKSQNRDAFRNSNYLFAVKRLKYNYIKYKDLLIKSLDAELKENTSLYNFLENKSNDIKQIEDKEYLSYLINNSELSVRDKEIIYLYFFENSTMKEIAEKYLISTARVSVIINNVLDRIRKHHG